MSLEISQPSQNENSRVTHSRFWLCFDDPALEESYTEMRHRDLRWYGLRAELLALFTVFLHLLFILGHNDDAASKWPFKNFPPSRAIPVLWLFFGCTSLSLLELARRRGSHYTLEKSLVVWSMFVLAVGPGFTRFRLARMLGEDPFEAWQQNHFEESPVMMAVSCAVCCFTAFLPIRYCASIWTGLAASVGFGSWAIIVGGSLGGTFWDVEHSFLLALLCFLLVCGSRRYELCERQLFLNLTQEQLRGERLATVLGKQMASDFSKEPPRGTLAGPLKGLKPHLPASFPSGTMLLRRAVRTNNLECITLDALLCGDEVLALDLQPPDHGSPKPCLVEIFKTESVTQPKHGLTESEPIIRVEWQRLGVTCASALAGNRKTQVLLKASGCEMTAVALGTSDLPLGAWTLGIARKKAGSSADKPSDWEVVDLELLQKEIISAKGNKGRDNVGWSLHSVSFEFLEQDRFLALLAFPLEEDHVQGTQNIVDSFVACYTYIKGSTNSGDSRSSKATSRNSESNSDSVSGVRERLESVPEDCDRYTV